MIDADLPSRMVSRAQTLVPNKLRGAELEFTKVNEFVKGEQMSRLNLSLAMALVCCQKRSL